MDFTIEALATGGAIAATFRFLDLFCFRFVSFRFVSFRFRAL